MSKHNYSQYSNKKNNNNNKVNSAPEAAVELQNGEVAIAEVETPVVDTAETVETETVTAAPEKEVSVEVETDSGAVAKGVVANCAKLNVRVKPSVKADVVCVLDAKTEVTIDVDKSNDEWLKVRTAAGADGYCMRKFVDANL